MPKWIACCVLAVSACGLHAQALLETWTCRWSPYRMVDDAGRERRLLKATLALPASGSSRATLVLRDPGGSVLDTEHVPPGRKGAWAHGFWLPAPHASRAVLELRNGSVLTESRPVRLPAAAPGAALPLRLDRLNRGLLDRLIAREKHAVPDGSTDVTAYLRQHDIVYAHPSPNWVEGLPLGNGDVGVLVSGAEGDHQTFHIDKTDIWYTAPDGSGLGRSFAGTLRIRYQGGARFEQRLSLGRAEVETRDGAFRSTARVHALRNTLEVEFEGGAEVEIERPPVTLWTYDKGYRNAARAFGSWARVMAPAEAERVRREAAQGPHTRVDWGHDAGSCWFVHSAPNLRTAVVIRITGAAAAWRRTGTGYAARLRQRGQARVRMQVSVATDRESADPLALARSLEKPPGRAGHLRWWADFWKRSWVELPDKLEENLWYMGLYQQAACSRSDQAVSFFGLWHPLDHRTWYDAYVADAQVPMMWWSVFGSNHLELLYPSHRTFGRAAAEFARRTPGEGMVVEHLFHPEWAGGRDFITGTNPHKGSTPWFSMNFWWDYLYSGDRDFLREVAYPLLRMTADQLNADLVKQADGKYHSLDSGSPEQDNTSPDNIYDWAMIASCYRAAIRASEILGVDAGERETWRGRLTRLFTLPGDGRTFWESPHNRHPYRCHPVVMFPLHPANMVEHGSPGFEKMRRTLPVVTRLLGFRYEDRHRAIPEFEGGVEPNGFSSGILTIAAARLGDAELYRRFLYGLIVRFHLKQNGLRALIDPRQSDQIMRASLVEAANAHTTAITETLLQSWGDHVRLFPCIGARGRVRFSGLRAAGGFVISAEASNGVLRWARIKSLAGGPLVLALPPRGERRLKLDCRPGATYEILEGTPVDLSLPPTQPRGEARSIPIPAEGFPEYPEDLPYGQVVRDGNLYLGVPREYGDPPAPPTIEQLTRKRKSPQWQDRQDAARLLARLGSTPAALEMLDGLCADAVNVVAHTAAVSLVRIGTPDALRIARKAAPGLQREVEKALRRRQYAKEPRP